MLVLTTLGLACDEVSWLFRHAGVTPPKAKHKPSPEDFVDKYVLCMHTSYIDACVYVYVHICMCLCVCMYVCVYV